MKFQVGDRILLLHSNEEGEIIDFINEKMVLVEVNGVKFPAYIDQIDFPYFKRFSEKKQPSPKKKQYVDDIGKEKKSKTARVADGVWLTVLPVSRTDEFGDEVVEELKLHLVNRTETAYHFIYKLSYFGKPEFELKNTISPFEDFYLHDIDFENLNDNPVFEFEFSLLQPDKKKAEFFESSLKLKAKQLFSRIEEIREKNEATFSYKLFEKYPDRAFEEDLDTSSLAAKGFKIYDAKKARQHLEPPRSVVDLHIEKLADNWKAMDNYEIIALQLSTFEKYYELAIVHTQPSLIVIHGVGEGRLRDEIHERLRRKKEVRYFINQYHPLYGYGATEIFFQY